MVLVITPVSALLYTMKTCPDPQIFRHNSRKLSLHLCMFASPWIRTRSCFFSALSEGTSVGAGTVGVEVHDWRKIVMRIRIAGKKRMVSLIDLK